MAVFQPADAAEAREVVAWAAAESKSLAIVGGGSKAGLGRPQPAAHTLSLGRLAGIVDYDPSELVITARAATPLAEITALLAGQGQMLAFEPPDWRGLLAGEGGEPTLGGTIACNLAGPRRVRAGAPRDHFLGFSAINGFGEAWKAGGRVVKNVTGYDMAKLQAGAFGTLSVLTELALRVVPQPETACTLLLPGMSDADAVVAMARALNTPHEVSAAAHLPARVARRAGYDSAVTALRVEGPAPSVAFRASSLAALFGEAAHLDPVHSALFWAAAGAVGSLLPPMGRVIWRICPTPSASADVAEAVGAAFPSAEVFYDWGGGLLWVSLDATQAGEDAGAAAVRGAVGRAGGHASLTVAPDAIRAVVPVFAPEAPALAALSRRVKDSFDPRHILNPGRMREGF